MNERGRLILLALNEVNPAYIQEAAEVGEGTNYVNQKRDDRGQGWIRYFATAACLCLALLGVFRLSAGQWHPG